MVKRPQYIRIKNPLHKHFAGMPMVGGSKIVKICRHLKMDGPLSIFNISEINRFVKLLAYKVIEIILQKDFEPIVRLVFRWASMHANSVSCHTMIKFVARVQLLSDCLI